MKTLILVRHAKSSWDNPRLSDLDRPLNERGQRDAPRMGKRLNEKKLAPDILLSSPANRALTTCRIIAERIGFPAGQIQIDNAIYHADEDGLLEVVRQLPARANTVMLFGHNPGFTDFANSLTKQSIDNIPTCGVVSVRFEAEDWKDVSWGKGNLQFFDFPKNPD